jgi:Fe-S-cluster containining protein
VEGLGGRCPFLEDGRETSCRIHPVRPERCRSWPFWEELRDPERLAEAVRLCPGIDSAPSAFTAVQIQPIKER